MAGDWVMVRFSWVDEEEDDSGSMTRDGRLPLGLMERYAGVVCWDVAREMLCWMRGMFFRCAAIRMRALQPESGVV